MSVCSECGGTVIEYNHAAGNGICVQCGTVLEENVIVNEIEFGETSHGAAMVQGSFVAQGATHARMSGPYGNRGGTESREQTIANANRKIQSIANALRLSEVVCLAATRLYTLAVEHKFTKGRKSLNVVAVCLYVACRQKETKTYMLIDFSDLLQVNVFELGHTYLQLVQVLNLRLPLVDPSHYISRFSALLEFGDETHKVATDAVRLVQRFDRDWMTRGRRPAGICGAALLLAARMNNFRRSVEEIVQVVKIADTTLRKRLDEFKATPSGSLTLADFRNVWLEDEMDPPAFTKGREREEAERLAKENPDPVEVQKRGKKKAGKSRKGKRKREDEDEDGEDGTEAAGDAQSQPQSEGPGHLAPADLQGGILEDVLEITQDPVLPGIDNCNIDPRLLQESQPQPPVIVQSIPTPPVPIAEPPSEIEQSASTAIMEEVETFLHNEQGARIAQELDEAERRRLAQITVTDELIGLDEDELDKFILNDDEVRIKERVWVELNRDYLEALAAKGDQGDQSASKSRKRRKSTNKPRDASTPAGGSAAESVRNLIKKNPKYSKRINYDALKDLFVDSGGLPSIANHMTTGNDEKDDEDLYTMDVNDKDDGEPTLIIEEGPGTVAPIPGKMPQDMDAEGDEEGTEDEKDDEDVGGGWEDAYEQEI
ncbi:cyclin-like protein [Coprinopsis marcescibilis]|uniref:B-related factor 1 n=1 Tax=Coprinopsis marcescibilis TaxID=230819 RepID=A0A5C3KIY4_COPMA|nr:cyclin-like protein [Coprinopsis marcescibilis]